MWYASCDDIDRLALVEALGAQDVWRRLEVLRVQPWDGMQEGVRGKVVLPSVKRVELAGPGVRRTGSSLWSRAAAEASVKCEEGMWPRCPVVIHGK